MNTNNYKLVFIQDSLSFSTFFLKYKGRFSVKT